MIALKMIVDKHPDCLRSGTVLRGLLKDYYPQISHQREINAIMAIYNSDAFRQVKTASALTDMQVGVFSAMIEQRTGISKALISHAVYCWAEVFQVAISKPMADSEDHEDNTTTAETPLPLLVAIRMNSGHKRITIQWERLSGSMEYYIFR
jgi:hypothetical protein